MIFKLRNVLRKVFIKNSTAVLVIAATSIMFFTGHLQLQLYNKPEHELPGHVIHTPPAHPPERPAHITKLPAHHILNCHHLLHESPSEMQQAIELMKRNKKVLKSQDFDRLTEDCDRFVSERNYKQALTEKELEFPLAFSIQIYKDLEQVERLLKNIYRPSNFYCIHVDAKASERFKMAVKDIVRCFKNIFLSSKSVSVKWGTFSVVQADLQCMEDLLKYKWKYFINLSGHDFPLKTNYQLVQILDSMKGTNLVDATLTLSPKERKEFTNRWLRPQQPAPHQISPIRGSHRVALSRTFVNFTLYDTRVRDFTAWINNTVLADEMFFASINFNSNLRAPGSSNVAKLKHLPNIVTLRNIERDSKTGKFKQTCHGTRVRDLCVFGIGDLPMLIAQKQLFASKFWMRFQPLTFHCLEKWLNDRIVLEYSRNIRYDVTYYYNLDIVRNRQ